MLMDMKARTEAMRALAYCTAACMDRAQLIRTLWSERAITVG